MNRLSTELLSQWRQSEQGRKSQQRWLKIMLAKTKKKKQRRPLLKNSTK